MKKNWDKLKNLNSFLSGLKEAMETVSQRTDELASSLPQVIPPEVLHASSYEDLSAQDKDTIHHLRLILGEDADGLVRDLLRGRFAEGAYLTMSGNDALAMRISGLCAFADQALHTQQSREPSFDRDFCVAVYDARRRLLEMLHDHHRDRQAAFVKDTSTHDPEEVTITLRVGDRTTKMGLAEAEKVFGDFADETRNLPDPTSGLTSQPLWVGNGDPCTDKDLPLTPWWLTYYDKEVADRDEVVRMAGSWVLDVRTPTAQTRAVDFLLSHGHVLSERDADPSFVTLIGTLTADQAETFASLGVGFVTKGVDVVLDTRSERLQESLARAKTLAATGAASPDHVTILEYPENEESSAAAEAIYALLSGQARIKRVKNLDQLLAESLGEESK